ncbi:hypothetical protein G7046_g1019 [Stylonectria norvegica]|nr:hypothetical protein G7046_g1019 [Stylonectria norvegica]
MASPGPDTTVLDPKSRDSVLEKEQPEINGHNPPVDSKVANVEPETPTVNGSGKSEEHAVSNGVSKDVEMENGDEIKTAPSPKDDAPPKEDESVKPDAKTVESKPESTESESQKPTIDTKLESNEDLKEEVKAEVEANLVPESKSATLESRPKTEELPVSDDVEMSGVTPANGIVKPTDSTIDDTDAKAAVPEKELDSEMTDQPAEPITNGEVNGTDSLSSTTASAPVEPTSSAPAPPAGEDDLQPASLSQLAIEPNEVEEPVTKPSIEVSMEDAPDPIPSVKVAREREDDTTDEPAPKRAKTEPREDETMAPAPQATSAPAELPLQELDRLGRLPRWNDEEFSAQRLTPHQRREIRKVLGRVKKTKQGGHFKDSVQRLWPGLWDSYVAKISNPTDLGKIDRTMRDTPEGYSYTTMNDFKKDLSLMYENTALFNGTDHDVTKAAYGSIRSIWDDVLTIPQEEISKPKPAPKHKPPRESRAVVAPEPAPRKPVAANPSVPVEKPVVKPQASTPEHIPDHRRASTATEGDRPKRTVRAPKPKDIDYSTKPSRKKMKPELQFCEEVLGELMHPKHAIINEWFLEAVDAEGLAIPHYYSVIKKPMDLGKVYRMLAAGEITSLKDFDKTVKLIFSNCYAFNGTPDQGNVVALVAAQLENLYVKQMKDKDAWLIRHAKANAPRAVSNASDDEDEDEEEEEVEESAPSAEQLSQIKTLEVRLAQETSKLNALFLEDSINAGLVAVQQDILTSVQQGLLKAKQSLAESRQKHEKSNKKTSKPSKSKSSGAAVSRKASGSAAHPKKSGGSKKAATKKSLTSVEKEMIASAINDLGDPHIMKAIDIIKRDTGQLENTDGELELEIDQLSIGALLQLWEVCKKAIPSFGKDSSAASASPEVHRAAPAKQGAKSAAKPKKNKPMSAREQEERIAQLRGLRNLYKPGQGPEDGPGVTQAPTPTAEESSDDSDSEEE